MDQDELDSSLSLKERKLKILTQKNESRKLKREEQKQLKTREQPPDNENINLVTSKFEQLEDEISSILKQIEETEPTRPRLPQLFDSCYCMLEEWQNMFSLASHILKIYHKKQLQDKYHQFNDKRLKLEKTLFPVQKFTFRKSSRQRENVYDEDERDAARENNIIRADDVNTVVGDTRVEKEKCYLSFNMEDELDFRDRENENLKLNHERIRKKNAVFRRLSGCHVTIEGGANTLHFVSLIDCQIVCGPVSTSVLVDDCKQSVFILACQQLRIHRTFNADFYVHVTSSSIIEDSESVRFAPYTWHYDNINEHFEACGLHRSPNNWYLVDDFNWLSSEPSPHWSIIEEKDRKKTSTDENSTT